MSSSDPFTVTLGDVDAAVATYNRERKALYHDDGRPIYADTEAREAAALAKLDDLVARAEEEASEAVQAAEREIDAHEHADPTSALSADELGRANARARFVKEDADLLPLPELAGRLRAALGGSDRAALYLLARYVGQRVDRELGAQRGGGTPPIVVALTEHLRDAWARFRDPEAGKQAEARIKQAREYRATVRERAGSRERAVARATAEMRRNGLARM